MKKGIILITVLLAIMMIFAGCTTDSKTDAENKKPVLKIGLDDSYPPMEYKNKNNETVGFDVDLGKAIGKKIGREVEFVSTSFDGIFAALDTKSFDIIMSAVSITPLRLKKYNFSKPYLSNGQVIVVPKGDTTVTKPEHLAGKKVGIQIGTTADKATEKFKAINDFEIVKYNDIIQTFTAMKTGRVDYIVVDYPVAIEYIAKDPESYEVTSAQLTNEPIGICFRKEDTELQEKVNKALEELKADGTLKAISEEWLGADYTSNIDEKLNVIE